MKNRTKRNRNQVHKHNQNQSKIGVACVTSDNTSSIIPFNAFEFEGYDNQSTINILKNVKKNTAKAYRARKVDTKFEKAHTIISMSLVLLTFTYLTDWDKCLPEEESCKDSLTTFYLKCILSSLLLLGARTIVKSIYNTYNQTKDEQETNIESALKLSNDGQRREIVGRFLQAEYDASLDTLQEYGSKLTALIANTGVFVASLLQYRNDYSLTAFTSVPQIDNIVNFKISRLWLSNEDYTYNELKRIGKRFRSILPKDAKAEFRTFLLIWEESTILEVKVNSLYNQHGLRIPASIANEMLIETFKDYGINLQKIAPNASKLYCEVDFGFDYILAWRMRRALESRIKEYGNIQKATQQLKVAFEDIATKMRTHHTFSRKKSINKCIVEVSLGVPKAYESIDNAGMKFVQCTVDRNKDVLTFRAQLDKHNCKIDNDKIKHLLTYIGDMNTSKSVSNDTVIETQGIDAYVCDAEQNGNVKQAENMTDNVNMRQDEDGLREKSKDQDKANKREKRLANDTKQDKRMMPHLLGLEKRVQTKVEMAEAKLRQKSLSFEKQQQKKAMNVEGISICQTEMLADNDGISLLEQEKHEQLTSAQAISQQEPIIVINNKNLTETLHLARDCHPQLKTIHHYYLTLKKVQTNIINNENINKRHVHYHLIRLLQGLMDISPLVYTDMAFQLNNMRNLLVDLILDFTHEEESKAYLSLEPKSILNLAIKYFEYVNNTLHYLTVPKVYFSENPIYQQHQETMMNKQNLQPICAKQNRLKDKLLLLIHTLENLLSKAQGNMNDQALKSDELKCLIIEIGACAREIRRAPKSEDNIISSLRRSLFYSNYDKSNIQLAKDLSKVSIPLRYSKDGKILEDTIYPFMVAMSDQAVCALLSQLRLNEMLLLAIEVRNQLTHCVVSKEDSNVILELGDSIVYILAGFIISRLSILKASDVDVSNINIDTALQNQLQHNQDALKGELEDEYVEQAFIEAEEEYNSEYQFVEPGTASPSYSSTYNPYIFANDGNINNNVNNDINNAINNTVPLEEHVEDHENTKFSSHTQSIAKC